jgi:hypothetical protein
MQNYITCHRCDFYVTKDDKQCPNCGTIKPWQRGINLYYKKIKHPKLENKDTLQNNTALFLCCIIFYGAIWIYGGFQYFKTFSDFAILFGMSLFAAGFMFYPALFFVVILFKIIDLLFSMTIEQIFSAINFTTELKSDQRNSLSKNEKSIQNRLQQIDESLWEMSQSKQDLSQQLSIKDLTKILSRIDKAIEIREIEKKKYIVKLWGIEMIRWQNSLQRLLVFEDLDFEQYKNQIESLRAKERLGKEIVSKWENQKDVFNIQEGQRAATKMQKLLNILDSAINKIVVDQATRAIQGISPARIFSNSVYQVTVQ